MSAKINTYTRRSVVRTGIAAVAASSLPLAAVASSASVESSRSGSSAEYPIADGLAILDTADGTVYAHLSFIPGANGREDGAVYIGHGHPTEDDIRIPATGSAHDFLTAIFEAVDALPKYRGFLDT